MNHPYLFPMATMSASPLPELPSSPPPMVPAVTAANTLLRHHDRSLPMSTIRYRSTLLMSTIGVASIQVPVTCQSPHLQPPDTSQYTNQAAVQPIWPSKANNLQSPALVSGTSLPPPSPSKRKISTYGNRDSYVKNSAIDRQHLQITLERWI